MNRMKHAWILAALIIAASANLWAGSVKVIANTSVEAGSISAQDLRDVFLETRSTLADGSHVQPVLAKAGAAHEAFLKEYLGKSDTALQTYYRSLAFSGKGTMPKALGSDAEVVAYVAKTKGAVGYVSADASTAGVKVLTVK